MLTIDIKYKMCRCCFIYIYIVNLDCLKFCHELKNTAEVPNFIDKPWMIEQTNLCVCQILECKASASVFRDIKLLGGSVIQYYEMNLIHNLSLFKKILSMFLQNIVR